MLPTIRLVLVVLVGMSLASASLQRSERSDKVNRLLELIESLAQSRSDEQSPEKSPQKKWCQAYMENGQVKQKCATGDEAGVSQELVRSWYDSRVTDCSSTCGDGTGYRKRYCQYRNNRGKTWTETCSPYLIEECRQEGCPIPLFCFPGNSTVITQTGQKPMQEIAIGDNVLAELEDGKLGYTEVLAHAQREPNAPITVLAITAERATPLKQKFTVRLTATHNIFARRNATDKEFHASFAELVKVGDEVLVVNDREDELTPATVTDIQQESMIGE